ncbi:unnamed protein product [Rotaria magnacalcarata]|nr:unnamed protein product [Rotaria magnacalcarata]CAF2101700.1 unnamed protein product [Rotaria magnacalcarata]
MTIDPTLESTPYVETQKICAHEAEEEILFSMHSICRINYCQPMKCSDDVWEISLILTSDNDPELQAITGAIRDQVNDVPGWHCVASLFLILGKFKEVHEIYDNLLQLQQTNDIGEITNLLQFHGIAKLGEGNPDDSIKLLKEAIKRGQPDLPVTQAILDSVYVNMGMSYFQKVGYPKAISFYEKALKSKIESLPNSRHFVGKLYNNISVVYCTMGQQTKADSIFKKAEERLGFLPDKHYELTAIQANVGNMSFD